MVPLTEAEMREIAAEPMSTRERRIACTALDWLDLAKAAQAHDVDDDIEDLAKMSADQINNARKALGAHTWESFGKAEGETLEAVIDRIAGTLKVREALAGEPGTVAERAENVMEELRGLRRIQPAPDPIPVVHTYGGDHTEVVIRISSSDPAILSLPMGVRLGLVVCDD
jgi:hypothetical protein